MYTVVIAEKEHIEAFDEYAMYLEPFRKKTQFALCLWDTEKSDSLHDMTPDLEKLVEHREEWRAIILCDERGISKRNPFDVIEYSEPIRQGTKEEDDDEIEKKRESLFEYYNRRCDVKAEVFRQAAREPLVRLVTCLCEDPVLTQRGEAFCGQIQEEEMYDLTLDEARIARDQLEYMEYRRMSRLKQELRDEIRSKEDVRPFHSPTEIICIAKRHNVKMDSELESVWGDYDERQYSRFYDWNMYFDQMRYLVYDITDKNQISYRGEYIRFLTAVSVLASNETPPGCMRPHRVYRLDCEAEPENMTLMLKRYFARLEATKCVILDQIEELRGAEKTTVTDEEVLQMFCHDDTIPVNLGEQFDRSALFCKMKTGLAFDCPADNEETVWMSSYQGNRKALKKYLQQPPRALKRATEILRELHTEKGMVNDVLTEFQIDDVQDYIDQNELDMVDTPTNSVYDVQRFYNKMEGSQRHVHAEMERRMKRTPTILFGAAALLSILIGMIPVLIMNSGSSDRMLLLARLGGISLLCVGVAGILCLIVYWTYLHREIRNYNITMGYIAAEVEDDAKQYSIYLSHACNFMRTTSALASYKEQMTGDYHKIRILQKHVADIDMNRAETQDIFGEFLHYDGDLPPFNETPFDYNFSRATDYAYPIQPMPDLSERITFLQKGSTVEIPYGTIREMMLRREELYD